MQKSLEQLERRIDRFIAVHYRTKALSGLIFSMLFMLSGFLILALIEHFSWSSTAIRTAMWTIFLLSSFAVLLARFLYPIFQSNGWIKRMSRERAAIILGDRIPEIGDKLLNTLQISAQDHQQQNLLLAAIDQKAKSIHQHTFQKAIQRKELILFSKYLGGVLSIWLLLFLFGYGKDLLESGYRVANFSHDYVKPAPFTWIWENENEEVKHNEQITLHFTTDGTIVPENAFIRIQDQRLPLKSSGHNSFSFQLPKVKSDIRFQLEGAGVLSSTFTLVPLYFPALKEIQILVKPPAYTNINDFEERNGNIQVPMGSKLQWNVRAEYTDRISIDIKDTIGHFEKEKNNFLFKESVFKSADYQILLNNFQQDLERKLDYTIEIIQDASPQMQVDHVFDSLNPLQHTFFVNAQDDYGIRSTFLEIVYNEEKKRVYTHSVKNQRELTHRIDLHTDSISFPKDVELKARIGVVDNDPFAGGKVSFSQAFTLVKVSREKVEEKRNKRMNDAQSMLSQLLNKQKQLQDDMQQLQHRQKSGEKLRYKDEERIREIMEEKSDQLQKTEDELQKIKDELRQGDDPKEDKMADRLEDQMKALRELQEEIRELLDNNKQKENLQKLEELSNKMQQRDREIKTELNLMKKLMDQKEMLEHIDQLNSLQEDLNNAMKEEDVERVEDELQKWEDKLEEIREKNPKYDEKLKENELDKDKEDLKEKMQKMDKKSPSKDDKQKAKEQMEKMRQKMMQSMMEMNASASEEDMDDLRQLLRNLVLLSESLEETSVFARRLSPQSPQLRNVFSSQQHIQNVGNHIVDSLYALASRVEEIESFVREEALYMQDHIRSATERLQDDKISMFSSDFQMSMKHANNLALLLDNVLQNMMMDMSDGMPGDQNCQKPGKGQPDISELLDQQKGLGEEMGAEDGEQEGDESGKSGEQGKEGEGGEEGESGENAAEIMRMMARQAEIKRKLQELLKEKGKDGVGEDAIDLMEEQEKDILFGGANKERLKNRQKEITSKMLELEKALREQEEDDEREGRTAEQINMQDKRLKDYISQKEAEIERLRLYPIRFRPFYRTLSNEYIFEE